MPAPADDAAHAKSTRRIPLRSILAEVNRNQIIHALEGTHGRVGGPGGAPARLGLKRTMFITRMKKLGIERNQASEHDGAGTDASDSSGRWTVPDSLTGITSSE